MKQSHKTFGAFAAIGLWFLSACNGFENSESKDARQPVARVYDSFLYTNDIKAVLPEGLSAKDSSLFVQNYMRVWAQDQLMIYKAELNLTSQQKSFEAEIEQYRNDLLKFAYQRKYVSSRLDTAVSPEQMQEYFRNHRQEFLLKEDVYQVYYVALPGNAPALNKAKRWFTTGSEPEELEDYALKYALHFNLSDTGWYDFGQVEKMLRFPELNKEGFDNYSKTEIKEAGGNVYLIKKLDYLPKGAKAPLNRVEGVVENILLNRRRLQLIKNLENNLIEDALKNNEFEKLN